MVTPFLKTTALSTLNLLKISKIKNIYVINLLSKLLIVQYENLQASQTSDKFFKQIWLEYLFHFFINETT